jgi:hypothetical protein
MGILYLYNTVTLYDTETNILTSRSMPASSGKIRWACRGALVGRKAWVYRRGRPRGTSSSCASWEKEGVNR